MRRMVHLSGWKNGITIVENRWPLKSKISEWMCPVNYGGNLWVITQVHPLRWNGNLIMRKSKSKPFKKIIRMMIMIMKIVISVRWWWCRRWAQLRLWQIETYRKTEEEKYAKDRLTAMQSAISRTMSRSTLYCICWHEINVIDDNL